MFSPLIVTKPCIIRQLFIVEVKHIRFKSSYEERISAKDARKLRTHKLAEILRCTELTAGEIVARNRNILQLKPENFIRNAKFCSEHLKLSDLVEFPIVLSLNSSLLQHRYFSLKELGCSNITASNILKFLQVVKKTPGTLQKEGISFSFDNKPHHIMPYLLDSENNGEIISRLQEMYRDGSSLKKIKTAMNALFFSHKLDCSLYKANRLLNRYPPLQVQSIFNTDQLLNLLLEKFGFSISKVIQTPNLLSLHHESVEYFFSEMPEILGVNTLEVAKRVPLLLRRPVDSVQKLESVLQDFQITDKQLLCCPKVFTFTPNTLQQRLETLCNSKDFSILKPYRKFLWLVYYYNNLDLRLQAMKTFDVPCCITMFTLSKSSFDRYLCEGKYKTNINDVCLYLAEVLDSSEKEIQDNLCLYPHRENSSLANCSKVVDFLLDCGITKKQLLNGLGVIFYDIEIVKAYFKDLENHPAYQPFSEWLSHFNLVQLLIYSMEVDAGFNGSIMKTALDEPERLTLSG